MNDQDKTAFEAWWPSVDQTIGKVAAELAWQAALVHRDSQPMVRLTEAEVSKIEHRVWANTIDKGGLMALFIQRFSKSIQDALEAKNRGRGCDQ